MLNSAVLLDVMPLSVVIVACALFFVAFQPPFAFMIWRDVLRARRRAKTSSMRGGTIHASLALCSLFGASAAVLQPVGSVLILTGVACVLVVLAILDYRYYWLPDRLTIPLGLIGLFAASRPERVTVTPVIPLSPACCLPSAFRSSHTKSPMLIGARRP